MQHSPQSACDAIAGTLRMENPLHMGARVGAQAEQSGRRAARLWDDRKRCSAAAAHLTFTDLRLFAVAHFI